MKFDVYQDATGEWRWRLVARNGRIVADGAESYASKRNARRAARRLWFAFFNNEVELP